MLNTVILMGRISTDIELKKTASDVAYVNFCVAVDRNYKKEEKQTDFLPVVAWKNTAEFIAKYFSKGSMIAISGELHSDNYTDKDGNKRTKYIVSASNVSFCGEKNENKSNDNAKADTGDKTDYAETSADDDDLPF